jgi:predicted enzyme related to lactoylglutathione lyase
VWEGKTYDHPRQHSIAIMCDDIDATVDELRAKGAHFHGPIEEREYGRIVMMIVPGADDMQLTSQNDSASGSKENGRTRKSTGK